MWDKTRSIAEPPDQKHTYVTVNGSDETDAKQRVADLLDIEPSRLRALAAGPDRRTEY
jgi:hypothetical protein